MVLESIDDRSEMVGMKLIRKSLSEQIYESLKEDILNHKIGYGEKLSNRELQQKFDVSSTPVRDAINRLAQDGLIDSITNNGARVISFDLQFALDINEIVLMLNCTAIRKAFRTEIFPEVKEKLQAYLLAVENNIDPKKNHYQMDKNFHLLFVSKVGNRQLQELYERYDVLRDMLVHHLYSLTDDTSTARKQHITIATAFLRGEQEEAVRQMEQHYLYAAELFKKNMK